MTLLFEPFESLFDFPRRRTFAGGASLRPFVPAADVVVTDDDVKVFLDLPGFTADDVEIQLVDDVLTIRGERALPYSTDGEPLPWLRLERGYGKFERILGVPKGLDPDAVSATMVDGVLTLHIPKPEARKPRRIEIATGATAAPAIESGDSAAVESGANADERELADIA